MKASAIRATLLLAFAAAAFDPSPARADDVANLQGAVRGALHAAKSFTLTFEPGPKAAVAGGSIAYVVVEPGRFYQTFKPATGTGVDTIVIGEMLYDRPGSGVFHYGPFAKERQTPFLAPLFDVHVVSVGADVVENGTTLGSFVATDPLAGDDATTVTCTYDKPTHRPVACRGAQTVMTYARYDDPALSVEVPAGALPYQ